MSTIIDALKRSDKERQINTTHTLSYSHLNAEESQTKIWIKYALITLLVSVVGIFIISSLFNSFESETSSVQTIPNSISAIEPVTQQINAPQSSVIKTETPIVEPAILETTEQSVPRKPNSALASIVKPVTESPTNQMDDGSRSSLSELVKIPVPKTAVVEIQQSAQKAEESKPLQQATQTTQEVVEQISAFSGYDNYSSIRVSQNLPDLHLDILKYHSDKLQRKAFINMQAYKEGEQISEGAELLQIGEKGVLLRYQGTDFVLRTQ